MGENGLECVVEYEYTAELGDELTLKVGDVITNVERLEGGWWKGTLRGNVGMFPDNFVKVLPGSSVGGLKGEGGENINYGKKRCRVLFSYSPAHDDELSLEVDETIDYICEVEDGWWKGRLNGRVGVFPSNFVEMCNSDCDSTAPNNHAATVQEKNKKNSLQGSPMTNGSSVLNNSSIPSSTPNRLNESINKDTSANLSTSSPASQLNGSMTTSERLLRNTAPAPDTAPRLPPKPVKEQCVVLFPYTAQNDDELSLVEGQIITIVSRDVEDAGWWKGELDGKVGVFPDNFVKILTNQTQDEDRDKKLQRSRGSSSEHIHTSSPIGTNLDAKLKRSASSVKDKPDTGLKSGSRGSTEKLSKKVGDIFKKSSSSLYDKGRSFNKSESDSRLLPSLTGAPTASKSPVFDKSAENRKSAGSESPKSAKHSEMKRPTQIQESEEKDREEVIEVVNHSDKPLSLDSVEREETLNNVTAKRVKAPKRRPPSNIFLKENIPDVATMAVEDSEDDVTTKKENGRSEGGEDEHNQNSGVILRDKPAKVIGLPVFPPKEGSKEDAQKPSWLEELSRKQANRRSGIFSDEKKPDLPSPEQKPTLPSKPSDNRKSLGSFSRRPNSFGEKQKSESSEKPTRPPFPTNLTKAASTDSTPDITATAAKSADITASGISKAEKRRQSSNDRKSTDKTELSRKLSDSSRKTTSSSKSDSGSTRKHSDSTATGVIKSTAADKPSVHSTNLGRPEGRSFAAVPERPADLPKTEPKSAFTPWRPTTTTNNNNAVLKSSTDSTGDLNDSVFLKQEPQTTGEPASIGWGAHILKPEKRVAGNIPPITQDKSLSVENQIEELRSSLASVQAEFAGQMTALKSLLDKERERRMELEAEVANLRLLVMAKKE